MRCSENSSRGQSWCVKLAVRRNEAQEINAKVQAFSRFDDCEGIFLQ
jgi:hypothetical protein